MHNTVKPVETEPIYKRILSWMEKCHDPFSQKEYNCNCCFSKMDFFFIPCYFALRLTYFTVVKKLISDWVF